MAFTQLAVRIKKARLDARLSQSALGKEIGLSDKSISSYEKGRALPSLTKLKKIAAHTHHPLSYFTQEKTDNITITRRLITIEKELSEIKKLLKRSA